jgi:hypothetical protein
MPPLAYNLIEDHLVQWTLIRADPLTIRYRERTTSIPSHLQPAGPHYGGEPPGPVDPGWGVHRPSTLDMAGPVGDQ